ncbi:beta-1,4-galactosyltransferase 1 [Elysia marginata]|uniref:Beta-1,4-galactosyltransferase 1 n=1 Tax=Elysia marginata TaxID=1093978 RepID=A0AAV4G974_9GAST|nr:beta-1,4-galactosyltransferase 1 [Elysia marginata]
MKHLSGGKLYIRFGFYLILGVVTVINMITLLSTDLLQYRPGTGRSRHLLLRDAPSPQQSPHGLLSVEDQNLQSISQIWDRHRTSRSSPREEKISYRGDKNEGSSLKASGANIVFERGLVKGSGDAVKAADVNQNQASRGEGLVSSKNKVQNKVANLPDRSFTVVVKLPNIVEHNLGLEDDSVGAKSKNLIQSRPDKKSSFNKKDTKDVENTIDKSRPKLLEDVKQNEKLIRSIIHSNNPLDAARVESLTLAKRKPGELGLIAERQELTAKRRPVPITNGLLVSSLNATHSKPSSVSRKASKESSTHTKTRQSQPTGKSPEKVNSNSTHAHVASVKLGREDAGIPSVGRDDSTRRENISCEQAPRKLIGRIQPLVETKSLSELQVIFPWLSKGGHYTPQDCRPKEKTAIIFPFRDRHRHLYILLLNLLPILKRQNVDFTIFVIEQEKPSLFNRGLLFNAGFVEASKLSEFDCFIFHDVDLIPLFDTNFYHCNESPTHFLGGVNKFNYGLAYKDLFGGVVSFTRSQYEKINGASNMYFGWGAEDDDMRRRIRERNMTILRTDRSVGLYDMIKHYREESNPANPIRSWLLSSGARRLALDGLNTLQYQRISLEALPLYIWVKVKVDPRQIVMSSKFFTKDADHNRMLKAFIPAQKNATLEKH